MSDSTSLRDTIEPKSDQLNADDLITGPITVLIKSVKRGSKDQPVEIGIHGYRPYRPCKSMRRVLIAAWGDDGHSWVGRRMRLYCDPTVKFGGVAVGGIRISHLSDIDDSIVLLLTTSKAKRSSYKVDVLRESYPESDFVANLSKWRTAIASKRITIDEVIERAMEKGGLTEEQIMRLKND